MIARRDLRRLKTWGVLAAITAIGAAVRLDIFLRQDSLWLDEARLALNLASRSFAGLAKPLAYDQSAPLLFLWIQKAVIDLWGTGELAFRLFPLLAGIATIGVIYVVGRMLAGDLAGAIAALLAAISPTMVKFSMDNKQYSVEALVTALLLAAYVAWLERPSRRRAHLLIWAGILAVWLSAPAVFVLISLTLAHVVLHRHQPTDANWDLTRAAAFWAVSFMAAYLLTYRNPSRNAYMARYWQPAFLIPVGGDLWLRYRAISDVVLWAILVGRGPLRDGTPGTTVFITFVTALILTTLWVGALRAARWRTGLGGWLLTGPILVSAAASLVRLYPFATRTMLFAAPLFYLLAGLGLDGMIRGALGRVGIAAGALSGAALIAIPGTLVFHEIDRTLSMEDVRTLVRRLRVERRPQDVTYLSAGALPTYAFYTTDWAAPDTARLSMFERAGHAGGPAFQNAGSRGHAVEATEGQALTWQGREGLELVGVPTGIEANAIKIIGTTPDTGWAEHEATRIRDAMGRGDAWVLLSFMHRSELSLAEELRRRGARITMHPAGITSVLIHAAQK